MTQTSKISEKDPTLLTPSTYNRLLSTVGGNDTLVSAVKARRVYGLPTPLSPLTDMDKLQHQIKLYSNFLVEELQTELLGDFANNVESGNQVQVYADLLDSLADGQVYLDHLVSATGCARWFPLAFQLVEASNYTKGVDGRYLDDKDRLIKGPDYRKPDLQNLFRSDTQLTIEFSDHDHLNLTDPKTFFDDVVKGLLAEVFSYYVDASLYDLDMGQVHEVYNRAFGESWTVENFKIPTSWEVTEESSEEGTVSYTVNLKSLFDHPISELPAFMSSVLSVCSTCHPTFDEFTVKVTNGHFPFYSGDRGEQVRVSRAIRNAMKSSSAQSELISQ